MPLSWFLCIESFSQNGIKPNRCLVVVIIECPGRVKGVLVRPSAVRPHFAHAMPVKLFTVRLELLEDDNRFDELCVFSIASVAKLLFRNVSLIRKQWNPCPAFKASFFNISKF